MHRALTILALGSVPDVRIEALVPTIHEIERLDLPIPPRAPFAEHRADLNRAFDAAAHDWILILRERESIDAALAAEIGQAVTETPTAWAYRIRVQPYYDGKPLRLDEDREGEIRLVHRRHCRFAPSGEMKAQGTVVRMSAALRGITFEGIDEHRDWLARTAVPHSTTRRILLFARNAIATGALFDATTRRYLWIEAGYDRG